MTTVSPESVGLGRSQKGWTSIFETGVSSRSRKRCGWGDGGLVTEVKKIVSGPGMEVSEMARPITSKSGQIFTFLPGEYNLILHT